jgi:histidyl-tRNA synthetase
LNAESQEFYGKVKEYLNALGISFIEDNRLVRGLDYYNHIVFEFISGDLGAQNTVLAGGRYDGLVSTMGGPATPAVGWGAGIERLMLLSDITAEKTKPVCVIAGDESLRTFALKIAQSLRKQGKAVEVASQTNIGKALKYANKIGAYEAYIYAGDEAANNSVTIKDLISGEQKTLPISQFS